MNVLLTSAGRRVELLHAFREASREAGLKGRIVATDIDPLAPALHVADEAFLVPPVSHPDYVPSLARLCRQESIDLVFPLIDPDIPVLAHGRVVMETEGARVAVVPAEAADLTRDKWQTFEWFRARGLPTPRTWLGSDTSRADLTLPAFVKPRYGSAGKQGFKAETAEQLEFFLGYVDHPVVQEFVDGPEITNDVFCSLQGRVWAVVSRKRFEVRWGEVAKGITIHDEAIQRHCVAIAEGLRAIGPITVQCMLKDGSPLFTEVNARFAGGSPLAFAAGVPAPRWYLEEAAGRDVRAPALGSYRRGLFLTRYDGSFFLDEEAHARLARRRL
ncbi:MAG TPA: ATP-grasp domain-containing protein [Anaerolineales bacterium]|nr:ATP-grasp domain-containing protein [Anaerolineales bacterium]